MHVNMTFDHEKRLLENTFIFLNDKYIKSTSGLLKTVVCLTHTHTAHAHAHTNTKAGNLETKCGWPYLDCGISSECLFQT